MTASSCAHEAAHALAQDRERKAVLDSVIALAEASVAAGLAELNRAAEEQAGVLDRIVREHAARRTRLPPDGPRIAPKRISPPATPPTPHEPDTFVADIASRLRHL